MLKIATNAYKVSENIDISVCYTTSDEVVGDQIKRKFTDHFSALEYITHYYKNVIVVCGTDTYDFLKKNEGGKIRIIKTKRNPKICSTLIRSYVLEKKYESAHEIMNKDVFDYYVKCEDDKLKKPHFSLDFQ